MQSLISNIIRRCKGSSTRTFVLFPILIVAWELLLNKGTLRFNLIFLPPLVWGYLQYHLCSLYRVKHNGGGLGMANPPEQQVTSGVFAYTRNPMDIGHLIFLSGMDLTFRSWLALTLVVFTVVFFTRAFCGTSVACRSNSGTAMTPIPGR